VTDMRGDVIIRTLLEWCQGAINSKMLAEMLEKKKKRRFMNKIGLRILAAQVMRNAYAFYKLNGPPVPIYGTFFPETFAEQDGASWYTRASHDPR
jgi:hypothetical protein